VAEPLKTSGAASGGKKPATAHRAGKILLVDDHPATRRVWSAVARRLGHIAIEASDGERAWTILQDNSDVELVMTDYQMPNLDGRGLVERMQGDARLQDLPVIMVSGTIPIEEVRDLLGLGVSRFLTKGDALELMKKYMKTLLDSSRGLFAG